jgi:hypothetical protein
MKNMEPKLALNYRHFTRFMPHETKIVRPRALPYGSYSEGLAMELLVLIGLAVLTTATTWMLVSFSIL